MTYGDSLAYVVYYFSGISPHSELESPEGKARANWYGIIESGLPIAFFDGTGRAPQVMLPDSFYSIYKDMIDGARAQKSVLEMSLDPATTRIDSLWLRIGVHITPTDSVVNTMTALRLVAVVYEDSVPYLPGDTVCYSPMTVRKVVGDSFGIPLQLKFGQDFDTLLTTPVANYATKRVGVAVFVQDRTNRAVLQSTVRRRIKL